MDESEEIGQLAAMFEQLGASRRQAETMARQLSKRATQLAEERGTSRLEALGELLKLVRSGREGDAYTPRQGGEEPNK